MKICLLAMLCLSALAASPFISSVVAATTTSTTTSSTTTTTTIPGPFYVSTTGSDTTGTGSIGRPFATITHAVAEAVSGQTIIVEPGTYNEMVVITKSLTLESLTLQPSTVTINASGRYVGVAVIGPAAAGTVIEGLSVIDANNEGIFVQNSLKVIADNNFVSGNGGDILPGLGEAKGIQLTGTSESTVAGNTVVGNMFGGIGVTDSGSTDASWNATAAPDSGIPAGTPAPGNANLISGNLVANNRPNHCAIVISSYNPGEGVSNNIVSGNDVVYNENGVIVAADTPNTLAIDNTVIDNNILNNGEGGVIVHSNAPGDVVTGNSILDNVISGDGYLPTLEGVIVGGAGNVPVANTTIMGNSFQNEQVGVQIVLGTDTMIGPNSIGSTVTTAYNGTGIIRIASPSSATVTTTETHAAFSTLTQVQTTTATQTATSVSTSGGLTFALALLTAVGTLIVGLIAGMIVRPIREASGK